MALGVSSQLSAEVLKKHGRAIEAALAIGLSLGAWVGMRETPIYIGAFSGVSPFVRVNKAATYQVGLVTGVYVPLLDFN